MANESTFNGVAWNDDAAADERVYTSWSATAILAAICGVLSFLSALNVWWGFLAVLAVLLGVVALVSIARAEGTLVGRRVALAGISMAVISSVAVAVFWFGYTALLRRDADTFCRLWLATVQDNNIPHIAAMTVAHWSRADTSDHAAWWEQITTKEGTSTHRAVHQIIDNPLIRTLVALGRKGTVSLYRAETVAFTDNSIIVPLIYAITFRDDDGKPTTFLVRIAPTQVRGKVNDQPVAGWTLSPIPSTTVAPEPSWTAAR